MLVDGRAVVVVVTVAVDAGPTNLIYRRIMIMYKYYCQKHRRGTVGPCGNDDNDDDANSDCNEFDSTHSTAGGYASK